MWTLLIAWLSGCVIPDAPACTDPQTYYGPSGDLYWGCEPPQGWSTEPAVDSGATADTGS